MSETLWAGLLHVKLKERRMKIAVTGRHQNYKPHNITKFETMCNRLRRIESIRP